MPQPFINPNYFNQYQPMYQPMYQPVQQNPQPYMDRLAQLQAQQMSPQQLQTAPQVNPMGKYVESIDIVKATDIPMDGNTYYFPKADGSEIYSKQWLPNGTTQILNFKPVFETPSNISASNSPNGENKALEGLTDAFMKRFDELTERLDRMEKNIKPTKAKKEVSEDE